ncbi:unnamed protein product [Acanthoscelides obtectus]|uniref:Myb/SANT-like DNA-binding domain-containing protein n=1 Tax=Acanthoscelides obtectus TaxID=200917 RepID=A0A9P0MA41_ACAOB|nr:unnamed protein product [Acanthoscelides obtectus]CAK1627119.1 hypothetical protein AOBTE_LOCUS4320 [Acanthoscelides obtectus]
MLLELYKVCGKKRCLEIKNLKILWERIADELGKNKVNVTPKNCLNRLKVLQRNYKKFIDNQNQTGRGHIHVAYAQEMDEIFDKKKNVHPELLLYTDAINEAPLDMEPPEVTISEGSECKIGKENKNTKKLIMKKKHTGLEKLRLDRKEYYIEKLGVEKEILSEIKKRGMLCYMNKIVF